MIVKPVLPRPATAFSISSFVADLLLAFSIMLDEAVPIFPFSSVNVTVNSFPRRALTLQSNGIFFSGNSWAGLSDLVWDGASKVIISGPLCSFKYKDVNPLLFPKSRSLLTSASLTW